MSTEVFLIMMGFLAVTAIYSYYCIWRLRNSHEIDKKKRRALISDLKTMVNVWKTVSFAGFIAMFVGNNSLSMIMIAFGFALLIFLLRRDITNEEEKLENANGSE